MRKFTLFILFISTQLFAQSSDILPIGFASGEEENMPRYIHSRMYPYGKAIFTPPTGNIRTAAGWEEIQAIVISWTGFPAILKQIVASASTQCDVLIHIDPTDGTYNDSIDVKNFLTGSVASTGSAPITLSSRIKYIMAPHNSIWIRDYAANTVYKNDVDSIFLVDWIYNRPRPDDDDIPLAYSSFLNIPLYRNMVAPYQLVNTGGNFMSDGMGTYFASHLIMEENLPGNTYYSPGKDTAEVKQTLLDWMGLDRYALMPVLPYDGIHHIDMHMKLLDETTLLVGEFPATVSDGPQIEANIQYIINNFTTSFGTPYKIVRIPMPSSAGGNYPGAPWGDAYYRTYTNFTFANKNIILPVYRTEFDTTALRILRENCPGYQITTIDADNSSGTSALNQNIISQGGVIHCITHFVGVNEPLLIQHGALQDTYNTTTPYSVNAFIKHKSGINNARMYWTTDTASPWNMVAMSLVSGNDYTANIPAQPAGTTIYYYIEAFANDGKTQVRPIVAPDGWYRFKVLGTNTSQVENALNLFSQSVFPNPSHGITCIPFFTERNLNGKIYVTDMHGKLVETIFQGNFPMGESKYFINTEKWTAGNYLIVAETNEGKVVQKLLVK